VERLLHAAHWLAEVARIRSEADTFEDPHEYPTPGYLGAVRNEYDTKTRVWYLNGPVWHTGQALRAVLIGWRRSGEVSLLDAARAMGAYVARNIIDAPGTANHGLLLAYEGDNLTVNNQTVVETLPGLFDLAEATGETRWLDHARQAADFLLRGFDPREGLLADHYHVGEERFIIDPDNVLPGRIALDDAAFVTLSTLTGDGRYRDAFLAMAERALREEDPPGNWIVFPPWHRDTGRLHVRCAWWWGYPLLTAYDLTGDERFLAAGQRAGQWYLEHQNLDGGVYYAPLRDGRHGSFALATSGAAVGSIIWADLYARTGDETYRAAIRRALRFLNAAQFSQECDDPNVRGALWETLNVPDGTTCPGFRIRDIASIFAIRAWDWLDAAGLLDEDVPPLDNAMPW
jgi:rhamnogalacturonyl hydrolase YesR